MTTPTLRTPADDELPTLLAELETTGDSIAALARSRSLTTWKLYAARRDRAASRFQPIRIVDTPAPTTAAPIELVLASGHRVVLPPAFDAVALRRLLEVVASC